MGNPIVNDIQQKIRNGNPITRLIIINAAVFLLISIFFIIFSVTGGEAAGRSIQRFFLEVFALPLSFEGLLHRPWTLITYMFTHLGVMHIFWNMITLFWFGEILSQYTSERKIIPLYILGGIAGGIITIALITFIPPLQRDLGAPLIGASAGVTAIIIAAATLVPEVRMNMMFIGPVKLLYVALFVIFIDILNVASFENIGGNLAHLGGALMGYLFIVQYKKGNDMAKPFNRFFDWLKSLGGKSGKGKMKVVYKRSVSDEEYNYQKNINQRQIDAILDKISKSGYESLSKAEKDILFKASNKK
ncbi:MAG: rhomboid family protease GlpG [Bacteroidota bacterium]|jgi:membrane associated rhomboid family serine protease|nr:rhomboid family protease GlpG [Bacteroidota bacterium]